jgi:hypothetical protein
MIEVIIDKETKRWFVFELITFGFFSFGLVFSVLSLIMVPFRFLWVVTSLLSCVMFYFNYRALKEILEIAYITGQVEGMKEGMEK